MFPTVFGGLFPLIVLASNQYQFLPRNATKFQSFRLFICAVCWATITTSSIMIAFLVRLLNSYNLATFSIQFFSYSIVAAIISLVAIFSQQFAEILVRPLFTNTLEEEEEEEDAKELDDLFLLQENMVYKKMETQIVKSRATAVSHASNCAAFSIVALFIGFAFCFPMKTFDIFEQPVFTVPCINQQIINNLQNVSMGFKSKILTQSLCSYSPCTKQDCYSFEPTLPPYLISNPSSPMVLADNGLTLEKGCQTFSLIQTCDSLGFRGLVGSFQVGANCTCAPIADNHVQDAQKRAATLQPLERIRSNFCDLYLDYNVAQQNGFAALENTSNPLYEPISKRSTLSSWSAR